MIRFRSIILDVDSTLTGLEGIDWLAAQRGPTVAAKVARLTELAMSGEKSLDDVFELRLREVRPSRSEVERLGAEYVRLAAIDAAEAIRDMQRAGVRVVMISGGIREAILPLAVALGVESKDVHAVGLSFTPDGEFAGHDTENRLAHQFGKRIVVEGLALPRPSAAVGDGMTDAEMKPAVDCFIAYTGFVRRDAVTKQANASIGSFRELREFVVG